MACLLVPKTAVRLIQLGHTIFPRPWLRRSEAVPRKEHSHQTSGQSATAFSRNLDFADLRPTTIAFALTISSAHARRPTSCGVFARKQLLKIPWRMGLSTQPCLMPSARGRLAIGPWPCTPFHVVQALAPSSQPWMILHNVMRPRTPIEYRARYGPSLHT